MIKNSNESAGKARLKKKPTRAERADRHICYEAAVQCVESEIDFVDAEFKRLRGRRGSVLREDFCGTGNASCEWVRRRPTNRALGVDLDPEVLAWGRAHHLAALRPSARSRFVQIEGDVMRVKTPPADMVLAMNFSYWLFKERARLRSYFKRVRAALVDDGVFFLDCFGGYDAFRVLKERSEYKGFTYIWDQAAYNPVTGDLRCHIHFRFPDGSRLEQAFTYDWRLWTLPEIREVLHEAGFARTMVYWQGWDEEEQSGSGDFFPVETADPDAGWICYLAALK
jgi:cyclopropane fatty-acyl-phospholipid synthase-like methyltransferase